MVDKVVISSVAGTCIPKPANDQNTDDVMPARFMTEITFKKMGEYVFYDERNKNGRPVSEHPFNDEKYRGGSILIAGANFGCGSSREHAPQALYRYGIRGIIAESFAEIFAGNCASLGIVAVTVSPQAVSQIVEHVVKNPKTQVVIDLAEQRVVYDGVSIDCVILKGRRSAFLDGTWDALTVLQNDALIKATAGRLAYLGW